MLHEQIFEELQAKKHVTIEDLFYIALTDVERLYSHLDALTENEWKDAFPEIMENKEKYEEYFLNGSDGILRALDDYKKYGFLATIHITFCDGFKFDKEGNPVKWEYHDGMATIKHVYGDTMEELIEKIREKEQKEFQKNLAAFKEKKQK